MARSLGSLGTPPAASDDYVVALERAVTALAAPLTGGPFGVFLNDSLGDCLTAGTLVESSGASAGFRMKYRGPILSIKFASGKNLSVTPNHQFLTPLGFVAAKDLKKFDYAIGTRGTDMFPWARLRGREIDVNKIPTEITEIFSTLALTRNLVTNKMPMPVDFHGDEQFFNGNIDIVSANSQLRRHPNASLHEPNGEHQIRATSQLKIGLHRSRSFLQRQFAGWLAALSEMSGADLISALIFCVRSPSYGGSFRDTPNFIATRNNGFLESTGRNPGLHAKISKMLSGNISFYEFPKVPMFGQSFRDGAGKRFTDEFVAPSSKTPSDRFFAGSELAGKLLQALPGFVTLDRVIDIEMSQQDTHVYDISTDEHWYFANGIITHNCVCADSCHQVMLHTANAGSMIVPTDQDCLALYEAVGGYVPGSPSTDQGCDETAMCHYLQSTGLAGQKSAGSGMIDPANLDHIRWSVQLFGACRLGIMVTQSMMDDFNAQRPWDAISGSVLGGHDVPVVRYDSSGCDVITWGTLQRVSWGLMAEKSFLDEAHAELWPDFLSTAGTAPNSFNLQQLLDALAQI